VKRLAIGNLELLPSRAVWREATRTLFVADTHLGKGAAFRAGGAPAPAGPTEQTLRRLGALCDELGPARLVVLGDFLHAFASLGPRLIAMLVAWRRERQAVECLIVRGNHDMIAGDPPEECGFRSVDEPFADDDVECRHFPLDDEKLGEGPVILAGHLHPVTRLEGPGRDSLRLPCFVISGRQVVLPAFGEFTGGAIARARPGARLVVTTDSELFDVK
jgi:DNA ligase-associated metallophosphoesterase